jgi:hypothetical protein
MSKTHQVLAQRATRSRPAATSTVQMLAATAAHALSSMVLRRAVDKARRELAALDDRMLADIRLDRGELMSLEDLLAEMRTSAQLAQFP